MADYTPHQGPFQLDATLSLRINSVKEAIWFQIGAMQSAMNDRERALDAFERVLAVNPSNVKAMTQAGAVLAKKECYPQAVSYLQRAISEQATCGEAWAVLAHCYVMTDDLQKAYQAYQSALRHLPNPRDPNLWYGIGLLYDRYGSLDNALEAFLAVLTISPEFERADEVCFCIGIIYKEQQKFDDALNYFNKVVVAANPPPPLTRADGWYQIGHVHELKREITVALDMYKHALNENPKHPKTLQNFGWLEHQHNNNSSEAISLLKYSAELDPSDGQTWYLLGRVYMALREFRQAYDAYQQAVYRDGRNATFWCSIGVLYYQMNQYRDAMDAYSRAIRLNPYVSEVWYDLGTLYESCGQSHDAIDAYRKAADLAPDNTQITARLSVLESSVNPGAHPQSQAQPHSGPQQQPQPLPPQQMQPDMNQGNQGHGHSGLISMSGRPVAPPLQQPPPPLGQDKLPPHTALPSTKLQPPPQDIAHTGPGSHPGTSQTMGVLPHRSTHMELAHIPAINTHGMPHGRPVGANGSFPQKPRGASLPTGSQTPGQQGPETVPAMIPQQLHALPAAGITSKQPDSVTNFPHRSAPLPSAQLPSQLSHQAPQERHNSQLPHVAPQSSQKLPTHLPQLSPQSQQPSMLGNQNALNASDQSQLNQGPQPSAAAHVTPREPQAIQDLQALRASHHSQQKSPHSQGQNQSQQHASSEALPGIHPLPIPQASQTNPDHQKRQDSQPRASSGPLDHQRMTHPHDADANRTQYLQPQVDVLRRSKFDRQGDRHELGLQKGPKPDGDPVPVPPYSSGISEAVGVSQSLHSSNRSNVQGLPSSGNRIPALREPMVEQANSQAPPRSMSMREITQSDNRLSTRPLDQLNQNGREQTDLSRNDSHSETPHPPLEKPPIPDRLPGMGSLAGPSQAKDPREDARLLTSVATPALAIPPTRGIPPMAAKDVSKPGSSPLGPPSAGGSSSALGTGGQSLPPLSGRNPSSIGGSGQEGKDSSGAAIGASSLTQFGKGFGRTPVTPVSNSVAPPSLPSPLSARKSPAGSVLHIARSPRITKTSSAANYKCVPIPPSSSQIESVPSPSSLPVLPALPSHPSNETQSSPRQKNNDHDSTREGNEVVADSRVSGSKGDDIAMKTNSNSGKGEELMMNKPLFGGLRSAPAPSQQGDSDRQEKDGGSKAPVASSLRHEVENPPALKREGPGKDELGRTAKRPRLHDLGEPGGEKSYGYETEDKHKKFGDKVDLDRKDDDGRKPPMLGSSKSDIPSYKDIKADLRASNGGQGGDSENNQKREGVSRSDGDVGKPLPMGGQVIDLPRLSTPMSKLGAPPPLSGNTPLPSFRTERMNLTASRGGSGSLSGKSASQDNVSRTSLPFPLRSAPVSSLPAPLKTHAPSPNRGTGDVGDVGDSGAGEESGMKRVADDKREGSPRGGVGSRGNVMADRVANGDLQKVSGGNGKHDTRGTADINSKDDKQAGRPEIHTSAT
eukprot:GFKZ01000300.1.p1 GENE.GFKZ01000300.1~~GFKZ01000300.1.p1  ORF type:complete len:1478 (-),score=198.14 GFKZ01000300.1:489-4922(-)